MSKILMLFIAAFVSVLLLTGIVELKFQPQKYVDVPEIASSLIKEKTSIEKGRAYAVGAKRKVELFVIQDKEKRLVLSLLYVKTDAQRLKELIEKEITAPALLPQAEMLVKSIDLVRTNAEKAPVEVVADMKVESTKSFTLAQEALGNLQEQYEEFEVIHTEFNRLTKSLEDQIGQLGLDVKESSEEVAGVKDEQTDDSSDAVEEKEESGDEKIPLKF
jgi:hypothetical protein